MTVDSAIQIESVATGKPFGYNLSVADFNGSRFLSYRFHPTLKHWRTEIMISKNGVEKPLTPPEQYKEHSIEDGRFFEFNGALYLSVTVARSRITGQRVDPCVGGYGALKEEADSWKLVNWIEPKHADNVWSKQTKNLCFFQCDLKLCVTWTTSPFHTVHLLDHQGRLVTGWRTESPKCPFGNYRGGTRSFPFKGNRLRFVHAVQNNPKATLYWGYALAAIVFQSEPPFRILQVSQQPILAGNEAYEPDCPHWKPRICIPYGAIRHGDGWKVAVGLNDCECSMVTLAEADLNL